MTREFIESLTAPSKELIVLDQSGHILCHDDYAIMENGIWDRIGQS